MENVLVFRAKDNVSTTLDQIRQKSNRTFDEIIQKTKAYSKSSHDVTASIEDQVRLIEKRNNLEQQREITSKYEKAILRANEEIDKAAQKYGTNSVQFSRVQESKGSEIDILEKDLVNELKAAEVENKIHGGLLREIVEEIKNSAREEIRSDEKGVRDQVRSYEKGELKNLSSEQEAKIQYQRAELDKGKGEKGGVGGVGIFGTALGVLGGQFIEKRLEGLISGAGEAAKANTGVEALGQVAKMTSSLMGAGVGSIPVVGAGLSAGLMATSNAAVSIWQKHKELENQKDRAEYFLAGKIGKRGKYSVGSLTQFGLNTAEAAQMATELAEKRGFAGPNLGRDSKEIVGVGKALSLDRGNLLELAKVGSYNKGEGDLPAVVGDLVEGLKEHQGGDLSLLDEEIKTLVSLTQRQGNVLEKVNLDTNAQIIGAFKTLGGSFGDVRAPERIMQMSNAMANPSNQYQQARLFSVLAQQNPDKNIYELKELQEKGLTEPGLFKNYMESIKETYGGDYMGMDVARKSFGLSHGQGRTLWEGFWKNPEAFDKMGTKDESGKTITYKDIIKEFGNKTASLDVQKAKIESGYMKDMMTGVEKVMEVTGGEIVKAIEKLGELLVN